MLEKFFGLFIMLISAQTYYLSNNFELNFVGVSGLGPGFFPKIVSVILFILGIVLFVISKKNKTKKKIDRNKIRYIFLIIFIFGIYIYIIDKLGYLASTILFAFFVMIILKNTSYKIKIIYSIIFSTGLYLLFTYLFNISLPEGILI